QRIITKLKHNNRNHRGSMDWKRYALTVPLEAFVMYVYATSFLITFLIAISIVQYRFLPTPHRFLGLKQSEKQ
ncbi:TPA: hypothetical protein ACGF2E_003590, partial [Vibrio cholerae]